MLIAFEILAVCTIIDISFHYAFSTMQNLPKNREHSCSKPPFREPSTHRCKLHPPKSSRALLLGHHLQPGSTTAASD